MGHKLVGTCTWSFTQDIKDALELALEEKTLGATIPTFHSTLGFYSSRNKYVEAAEYKDIIRNDFSCHSKKIIEVRCVSLYK